MVETLDHEIMMCPEELSFDIRDNYALLNKVVANKDVDDQITLPTAAINLKEDFCMLFKIITILATNSVQIYEFHTFYFINIILLRVFCTAILLIC